MKISEDLFCFCYMFLSSIGLLYQLGNQSIVTVQCEISKTFCLKHIEQELSFRHTYTAKELEIRCNNEGYSIWIRCLVLLGIFFELVIYGSAVYVYYYKPKTIGSDFGRQFYRYVYASIIGVFICIFLLLPFASYILPSGGPERRGVLAEMWASPLRGLVLLILNIITAPFRCFFHNQFKTELGLDKLYENFTCVEPSMEDGLLKCPIESHGFPNMPDPSNCENDFFCTQDCLVVFPSMVINSLAFIFASLALFYRLLRLTHYITERETGIDLEHTEYGSNTVILKGEDSSGFQDRHLSVLDETNFSEMKDKSVRRTTMPKAGGLRADGNNVYPRRNATRNVQKRRETKENTPGSKTDSQSMDRAQQKIDSKGKVMDKFNDTKAVTESSSENFEQEKTNLDHCTHTSATNIENNWDSSNGITPASSELFDVDGANLGHRSSEHQSFVNHRRDTEYRGEQKTSLRKNSLAKERESKLVSTSKKHRVGFTGETVYNTKNGKTITNGHSEYKLQRKTSLENSQGKATRPGISNGHLRKDAQVYRRAAKVENGVTEVNMGSTGNCNGNEGYEEVEQWSPSEDIVDGIEGLLVVEDESEFYMSGFRL